MESGTIDRLAISMPPRHGKSETLTIRYPVYCLQARPDENVLITGYNERFARKFSRRARTLARERGLVGQEKAAQDEWETPLGGLVMARGVGSPPTGTGFARVVIDDPIRRREDADSEVYREKLWDWYSEDILSRLEPGGAVVIVATRWHHDDLIARAIASEPEKWRVLNLPALGDDGRALWPSRYPAASLHRIRDINPRAFEALYQGNPTPREGSLFLVGRLGYADAAEVPAMVRRVRRWDMASTKGGDYTAGVLMGLDESGRYWVLDVVRVQLEPDARNRLISETARRDGPDVQIVGPEDPGAAGKDMALAFARNLSGFSVRTVRETGSKELRADPYAAQVNAGNVTLVRGSWNTAYVEELRQFPAGAHDDQVDASSGAFVEVASGRELVMDDAAFTEFWAR